jgi:hypothetical protein
VRVLVVMAAGQVAVHNPARFYNGRTTLEYHAHEGNIVLAMIHFFFASKFALFATFFHFFATHPLYFRHTPLYFRH